MHVSALGVPQERRNSHLLDLQALDLHATHNIGKQGYHIVVTHGHVGNNLLESDLLGRLVFVLFATAV